MARHVSHEATSKGSEKTWTTSATLKYQCPVREERYDTEVYKLWRTNVGRTCNPFGNFGPDYASERERREDAAKNRRVAEEFDGLGGSDCKIAGHVRNSQRH